MIRNTNDIIKKLKKIGEQKIEQGVWFKEMALNIEHHRKQKTFKEWMEMVNKVLDLGEVKGGLGKNDNKTELY